ncbi:Uncharacterised protein [Klebsiella pneumoniae subsp. pneumoniae]|nr:Uncharacterised protein [Klebsiella pneumoniae subsp. pneumoniae]
MKHHARSIGLNTRGLKLLFLPCWPPAPWRRCRPSAPFWSSAWWSLPGYRVAVNRSLPAPAGYRRVYRQPDQFLRRLAQLLSRRRHRRHYRGSRKRCCSSSPLSSRRSTACWPAAAAPGRPHAEPVPGPVPVSFYGQCDSDIDRRRHSLRAAVGVSGAQKAGR